VGTIATGRACSVGVAAASVSSGGEQGNRSEKEGDGFHDAR